MKRRYCFPFGVYPMALGTEGLALGLADADGLCRYIEVDKDFWDQISLETLYTDNGAFFHIHVVDSRSAVHFQITWEWTGRLFSPGDEYFCD